MSKFGQTVIVTFVGMTASFAAQMLIDKYEKNKLIKNKILNKKKGI